MTIRSFFNLKRWAAGLTSLTIMSAFSFYFYTDHHLTAMYGGHTKLAETPVIAERPDVLAITNVNVLAATSDSFRENQTVLIRDGHIETVSSEAVLADDIETVDGDGMYLVPGYTDSHAHLWESENDLLLFIANGVTQIREMNGSEENIHWKNQIEAGRIGPDIFVVSPQVANFGKMTGWFAAWTQRKRNATSPDALKDLVKSLEKEGYDAIKASSFLDSKDYLALNEAMKETSLPLVGHIPYFATLDDFWMVDQTEVAHIEEFVKPLRTEFGYTSKNAHGFLDFVRERSDKIAERLKNKNIHVTSTLALIDSLPEQVTDLDSLLSASQLQYVNPGISEGTSLADRALGWLPDVNRYRFQDEWDNDRRKQEVEYFKNYSAALHIMFEAMLKKGVPILVGTDTNVSVMVPGFSIHEEMQTLNDAGMTPAQVLAAATSVPAQWMGWKTGQISPGFKANLVLLRENPLLDIAATDSIEMVIVNGNPFSRSRLDEMLQSVEIANDKSRKTSIKKWQ